MFLVLNIISDSSNKDKSCFCEICLSMTNVLYNWLLEEWLMPHACRNLRPKIRRLRAFWSNNILGHFLFWRSKEEKYWLIDFRQTNGSWTNGSWTYVSWKNFSWTNVFWKNVLWLNAFCQMSFGQTSFGLMSSGQMCADKMSVLQMSASQISANQMSTAKCLPAKC